MFTVANDPVQLWSHRAGVGQLLGQICLRFVSLSTVRPEHNHTRSSGPLLQLHPAVVTDRMATMFPLKCFLPGPLEKIPSNPAIESRQEQASSETPRRPGRLALHGPFQKRLLATSRKFPPPPLIPSMALLAAWGAPGPSFLPDSSSRVFSLPRFSEHTLKLHSLPSTPLPKFSRYHSYPLF